MKQPIAFSFDVECYYQIVYKDYLDQEFEPTDEALRNTSWILDLLKEHNAKATFFFLGNIAQAFPQLVARAVADGHEIGVHGDRHDYVHDLTPTQFHREIFVAMEKIRAAGARDIAGHRAPAFSINRKNIWALDVLRDLGLRYDSSIVPFAGKRYGVVDWPRQAGLTEQGIVEIPLSVIDLVGRPTPCMGGGYVRYFPLAYTRWCAGRLAAAGLTPITYFHPYEFESGHACIPDADIAKGKPDKQKALRRMNAMQSIGRGAPMRRKLEYLVKNYSSVPVGAVIR